MPKKGKMPEWERQENRTKIFRTLLDRSLNFTELLKETGVSRSTLSQHLKDLQKDKVLERAVENRKVVYRTTLNEERILSELKRSTFDFIMEQFLEIYPEFVRLTELYLKFNVNSIILRKKRVAEGKPPISSIEDFLKAYGNDPVFQEFLNVGQKIQQQTQETVKFFEKYYDSEKKMFNRRFWEAWQKISTEELEKDKE